MDKEVKVILKELKQRKKIWAKHLKALQKVFKNECHWLNLLLEVRLPYLRKYHAAYKRELRQLHRFPVDMGETQTYIADCEYLVEETDRAILDVTLKEILKND